jgi:hypothetical protein
VLLLAADGAAPEWEAALGLVAECDAVVGVPAFFATAWVVVGWAESADECATGFGALLAAKLSWAHKPLAARQTPVNRTKRSLLVLCPEEFKPLLSSL